MNDTHSSLITTSWSKDSYPQSRRDFAEFRDNLWHIGHQYIYHNHSTITKKEKNSLAVRKELLLIELQSKNFQDFMSGKGQPVSFETPLAFMALMKNYHNNLILFADNPNGEHIVANFNKSSDATKRSIINYQI